MVKSSDSNAWRVEHACPQCGAPVELEETDRFLACPYCRVNFYLATRDVHRFRLPPPKKADAEVFYVPYWRCKGVIFSCVPYKIENKLLDATIRAAGIESLPDSMGFRPQVLKLKFLLPGQQGRFVKPEMDFQAALTGIHARVGQVLENEITPFYTTFIGETVSIIYAPFYYKDGQVFDGVTLKPLGVLKGSLPEPGPVREEGWHIDFVPALCPHCGWDLGGDRNSLVLVCENCLHAWESTNSGLSGIDHRFLSSAITPSHYLPFWRIKPRVRGLELESYADLIRVANMPKAIRPEWENRPAYFWTPAFRVNPQLFLRLSRIMTTAQPRGDMEEPQNVRGLAPAGFPAREAVQSLKLSLANLGMSKKVMFARLDEFEIESAERLLVFVPFHLMGRELVNEEVQISIDRGLLGIE